MDEIRAVYFDFGGTLFSYGHFRGRVRQLISDVSERFGAGDEDRRTIGQAYQRGSARAFAQYNARPYYLHRDLFTDTFRHFAEHLERRPSEAELAWAYEAMRDAMIDSLELRADCLATLRAMKRAGLCLAIVSNIDDDFLHPMVEKVGLPEVLDHHWSSEEARSCKPDPGFFRYALERTGHAPEEVLFVGDSPDHDVAGAAPLGMKTALIVEADAGPPGQRDDGAPPPKADHEIRALSELLDLLGLDEDRPSERGAR